MFPARERIGQESERLEQGSSPLTARALAMVALDAGVPEACTI
jgi:hypothetical protein